LLPLALAGCASSSSGGASGSAVVKRVGDGDTLDVRSGLRVRLVQVDAPELGEGECFARESKRELERLVPPGTSVELERDRTLDDVDRYGRLLRYVMRETRNVNVELVRRGAATPYFFRGDRGRHAAELLAAVDEARRARRGMWGACRVTWTRTHAVDTRPR
jgi:micrococcal nuclease